jgi:hypothetical protein
VAGSDRRNGMCRRSSNVRMDAGPKRTEWAPQGRMERERVEGAAWVGAGRGVGQWLERREGKRGEVATAGSGGSRR